MKVTQGHRKWRNYTVPHFDPSQLFNIFTLWNTRWRRPCLAPFPKYCHFYSVRDCLYGLRISPSVWQELKLQLATYAFTFMCKHIVRGSAWNFCLGVQKLWGLDGRMTPRPAWQSCWTCMITTIATCWRWWARGGSEPQNFTTCHHPCSILYLIQCYISPRNGLEGSRLCVQLW